MMLVPNYWAEAKRTLKHKQRQVTLKRFGWSDIDPKAAQQHAEQRLQEAIQQFEAGQDVRRIDHKIAYNGAEGIPIREEVIERHGEVVITRNGYGALCLNTPNVMFADVDLLLPSIRPSMYKLIVYLLVYTTILGLAEFNWALLGLLTFFFILDIALVTPEFLDWKQKRAGGAAKLALDKIKAFSEQHPDWHLRIYQTPAGYRILVMHRTFDPLSDEVKLAFEQLNCDPIYILMCKNQHCFRARVSPKPWRIGLSRIASKATYPFTSQTQQKREQWLTTYEPKAKQFAACRFIEQLGSLEIDPQAEVVRVLHDQLCQSTTQLPLA